ncbi:hypothetical protein M758_9G128000 [Ceratodon purpureus]|nr:hypothetical protein M758_9G128000 [Ceratodon purpureus]
MVPSCSGVGVRGGSETLQAEPSVCPFSLRNKERGPQRAPAGQPPTPGPAPSSSSTTSQTQTSSQPSLSSLIISVEFHL